VAYLAESYGGDNENHYSKLEEKRCLNREKSSIGEWQTKQKHQKIHICDNRGCKQEKYRQENKQQIT
jgi:hypothetical protein